LREQTLNLVTPQGASDVPMLNALNEVMRESYLKDCEIGLKRCGTARSSARLAVAPEPAGRALPALHRAPGRDSRWTLKENLMQRELYEKSLASWIPSESRQGVRALAMHSYRARAGWAAGSRRPERSINNLPLEHEYVKLHLRPTS